MASTRKTEGHLKRDVAVQIAFGVGFILVFLVSLQWLLERFPWVNEWLKAFATQYGLAGTFVLVFLGSTLLPFPTDVLYSTTIALAPQPYLVLAVAIAAATLAAFVNYALAYVLQERFIHKLVGKDSLDKFKPYFDKWGAWGILFFGIIPVSPVFDSFTFLAGMVKMDVKRFALFTLISRAIHYGVLTWLALNSGGILTG